MSDLSEFPDLTEFTVAQVGDIRSVEFAGWDHGESLVWRIESELREVVYLKTHRQPGKFRQETHALKHWTAELPAATPILIATHTGKRHAFLMSAVPGKLVELLDQTGESLTQTYRSAGRFLAALHAVEYCDDDIPVAEAMHQRTLAWCDRAKSHASPEQITWVRERMLDSIPLLNGYQRVPCHRDFSPRNWMIDERGRFGVIDFEHSRADLFLLDFERQWSRQWFDQPQLASAFWQGYGRYLTSDEEQLLERCAALSALSTITWAREHNDKAFESHGRRVLARLMDAS